MLKYLHCGTLNVVYERTPLALCQGEDNSHSRNIEILPSQDFKIFLIMVYSSDAHVPINTVSHSNGILRTYRTKVKLINKPRL